MTTAHATTSSVMDTWDTGTTASTLQSHFNTWISSSQNKYFTKALTTNTVTKPSYNRWVQVKQGGTGQQTIVFSDIDVVQVPKGPIHASHEIDEKGRIVVRAGDTLLLPDGTEVIVDKAGNYTINDADAKVVYKANRSHEFNRYVNASDLLEEFLRYLRSMGVTRKDVMKVDLGVFVTWLIIAAAEADGMEKPPEEVLMLESQVKPIGRQPTCKCCKRFIPRKTAEAGVFFCNGAHMDRYRERVLA